MSATHADVLNRCLAALHLIREVREMADTLPEQHVRTNKIKVECYKVEDMISKKLCHAIWAHGKHHRRASGV